MRVAFDVQHIYDHVVADLRNSKCLLNIPFIDRVMTYREYENLEYIDAGKDLSTRELAATKRTMDRLVKELSREILVYCCYSHFLSIPPGIERMLIKLFDDLFIPTKDRQRRTIDNSQALGFYALSNSVAEGMAAIDQHNFDRWAIANLEFKGNSAILTVGRNLKDYLFEEAHGKGRWRGVQYFPTGRAEVIEDEERVADDLLSSLSKVTDYDARPKGKPATKPWRIRRRPRRKNLL